MRSIRFRFLIAALAVVLGTAMAKAQDTPAQDAPPPAMHGHGHGHGFGMFDMGEHMKFLAEYLDLTDVQKTQVKAVLAKEHATVKPLFQQLHQSELQLRQYEEGTFDEAKVRAVAAQQSQTMVELMVRKARIHNELFQLLTPDQQAKMKEVEARRDSRIQKHIQSSEAAPQQ